MRAALIWLTVSVMVITLAVTAAGATPRLEDYFDLSNLTERADGYYTLRNQADGSVLLVTARILHIGNRFLDRGNNMYLVTSIDEDTAWAEPVSQPENGAAHGENDPPPSPFLPVQGEGNQPKVGVYHSHGAESYVPSDGTESIDEGGGILDVGDSFSRSLEEQGVEVVHSKEPHVPHDAGAYHRSRRTAEEMLTTENVDLIIDVHRDAVPPETYEGEVNGQSVTQILLVVGEQNQNSGANWQLARELKDLADERYPGLVKGILGAPGSYNQDLAPQAILIEVGAHENNKEDAERAVTLFADVVNEYMTGEAATARAPRASRVAFRSALIVLLVLAAALFTYLLIAAGSWEEFKRKAASFFQREFADVRRGFSRRRDDDDHGRS